MGDAAHVMPPETGQGVSCAAEDAVAIGLLLGHYTANERDSSEAFRKTARAYEAVRLKHVGLLLHAARHAGKSKRRLSWWQEWVRDTLVWLFCLLPLWLNDWQYGYDVEADVAQYLAQEAKH
jgi:2-polyprenyl-6-methoxyphenol hydroxylase-like FAD-dependent oxidoreductase